MLWLFGALPVWPPKSLRILSDTSAKKFRFRSIVSQCSIAVDEAFHQGSSNSEREAFVWKTIVGSSSARREISVKMGVSPFKPRSGQPQRIVSKSTSKSRFVYWCQKSLSIFLGFHFLLDLCLLNFDFTFLGTHTQDIVSEKTTRPW